jgi:2-polyprenyl-3-methyl-5-hydroxy-6-metoxy-1,4-benzoquinol methylase
MTALRLEGRVLAPERMDHEAVTPEDLARALRDLERLTAWGLAHRPVLDWLGRIARGQETLSVLDVGSGGGDALRRIARWAAGAGVAVTLEGVDLNPTARVVAQAATDPVLPIRFRTADVFDLGPEERWDVIVSSHFAHHLSDADLVRFLRWMEGAARLGWFVNDLHRHWLPYRALQAAGAALPLHRFVVSDGPISVRRAFVRSDWERAVAAAGIERDRVEIAWWTPFRWGVGVRPGA